MIVRNSIFCSLVIVTIAISRSVTCIGQADGQEAEDPSIVTTELDKYDLVVKMRPILPEITTGDPLRIAIHFEKKTGPIDHSDQVLGPQLFDRVATVDSMDIAIKAPGGKWELFQPDADEDTPARQSSLISDATLLLELMPDKIMSLRMGGQEEFAMPWEWDGELKQGEYQIAVRGTLNLSTRERTVRQRDKPEEKFPATQTEIAFKTKPITVEVARADMRNQTLEELAKAAVEVVKEQPEIEADKLEVQSVESLPIADKDGNRVIRVRANIPKPKPEVGPGGEILIRPVIAGGTGYWQYEVAMTAEGKPATVARWRKGFCVAQGTMISTPDGEVAVEELQSGRQVWSLDIESNSRVAANVLAVLSSRTRETILINENLQVSPDHPVFVASGNNHMWKQAAELQVGETLLHESMRPVKIRSVAPVGGEINVYDVAVDGPHNFFAAGILVHNKSIAWTPKAFVPWYALWNRAPIK